MKQKEFLLFLRLFSLVDYRYCVYYESGTRNAAMNNTDKSPYLVNFMAGERNDTNDKDGDKEKQENIAE